MAELIGTFRWTERFKDARSLAAQQGFRYDVALACGFFWELWNFYSYPKWTYHIPVVGHPRLFEMPLLGNLGYLPFGLELYPMIHLLLHPPPSVKL